MKLSDAPLNRHFVVTEIFGTEAVILIERGLRPGIAVVVQRRASHAIIVKTGDGLPLALARSLAENVQVSDE